MHQASVERRLGKTVLAALRSLIVRLSLFLAPLVSVYDLFEFVYRFVELSLAEIKMAELDLGFRVGAVRYSLGVQPRRILEVVFTLLRSRREQSLDISLKSPRRHF